MLVSILLSCCVVLLLRLCGTNTVVPSPACPVSCLCQETPFLNCSSSGLSKAPSLIPTTATSLDLSHNALHSLLPLGSGRARLRGLQHLWVGNNALERLSLCLGKGTEGTKTLGRREGHCVPWAPDLQLLSAERNQLKCLPRGLGSAKSLQVLQLSHNRISKLGPADAAGCTHLRELYLQHNLINTIHPWAFKDLKRLQVLDLRYNLLTIIPTPAYLSLRSLSTSVAIAGNKWRCDCNLKTLRRWLSFDSDLGKSTWKVVCSSPPHHAGKDLLHLEESEVVCSSHVYNTPGLYKEETVDEGKELLLSCDTANQDFMQYRWWTPNGHVSQSQQILLSNITERHAGLYVCVSGFLEEQVSVFNLNVRKRDHDRRLRREVKSVWDEITGNESMNMQNNIRQATARVPKSDFVLAVCLSVFITFIVAFFLGVLLRPILDKLYKRIRTKRDSTSPPNSTSSSTGPRPYVNEGYSDNDDQIHKVRAGSRVTFGGVTEVKPEAGNIPYYVTVEDAKSDSSSDSTVYCDVDASYEKTEKKESLTEDGGAHCIEVDNLRGRADSNPSILQGASKQLLLREKNKTTSLIVEMTKVEELQLKCVSSISSYDMKDSIEQSVDSSTVTLHYDEKAITEKEGTIPGFSVRTSEPREENVDAMDPDLWNDSGESFSFSDGSPRSSSRISELAVLDCPLSKKEMSVDVQSDRQSSCNTSESGESEGGQTQYTVNPEQESEAHNTVNDNIQLAGNRHSSHQEGTLTEQPYTGMGTRFRQHTITLDPSDVHIAFIQGDSFDDEEFTDQNEFSDSSNINSENEEEPIEYHVHPVYRTRKTITSLLTDKSNTGSASEDKCSDYPRRLEITELEVRRDHSIPVTIPDRVLNINFDNSSSSTDIEEKTGNEGERKTFKGLSALSALLLTRSRAETDQADQPLSKTTNTDSGRFLGLTFNRPTVSSEGTVKPMTGEESLFGKIGQAFDRLPKLNRSLLFSISDPQPSAQSASKPVIETEFESQRSHLSLSSQESFFGNTDVTLDAIPREKGYLEFSQSEPHLPTQSPSGPSAKVKFIPKSIVKIESRKSSCSSEHSVSMPPKESNIFGHLGVSFDDLPKVKHHLHFSTSESWRSDSLSAEELSPTTKENSFFGQVGTSLEEVPKIKRYLQFTQSEPVQAPSTLLKKERVTPELVTNPQSWRSDSFSAEELSPSIKENSFFGQVGTSLEEVPKIKRYLQFTQSEPVQAPSTFLNKERVTPELVTNPQSWRSDSFSAEELSPSTKENSFFGQVGTSLEEVPKIKRYLQFTQSEPVQAPSTFLNKERVTPELVTNPQSWRSDSFSAEELSPSTKENSFFGQVGTSLEEVPKIKRYLQFTQSEPVQAPSTFLNKERVTPELVTNPQSWRSDSFSAEELSPSTKENSFFGQVGTSLEEVPKIKRYLQFTQSEPELSVPASSTLLNTERVTPELVTKPQSWRSDSLSAEELSPTTKENSFFGQVGTSLEEVPKIKRYLQFTQSEPVQHPSTLLNKERVTPELVTKPQSWRSDSLSAEELSPTTKENSFFGQVGTSLEEVTKIKRYLQFTQSEPVQHPSTLLNKERVTPELVTKPQSWRSDSLSAEELSPTTKENSLFGQVGTSLEEVPKVKRYLQFTQSELHILSQSQSQSSVKQVVPPEIMKKGECKTSGCPSNNFAESSSSFSEVCTSLDNLAKVKRCLHFTQSEPQSSNQSLSLSLNTERAPIDALTKTEPIGFSSSCDKDIPFNQGTFIGQIGLSLDQVPKVERYLHFSQCELHPTSQPVSINIQEVPITEFQPRFSKSFEDIKQTTNGDNFFDSMGSVDTSVTEIPKLKRYLKFTHPQVSAQPPLLTSQTERVTLELGSKSESTKFERRHSFSFENELKHTTNLDFFGKTDAFHEGIPKVNRYINFSQSVPYTPTMSPSPSSKMWETMNEGTASGKAGEVFKLTETLREDSSLEGKVVADTSMVGQLRRPERSLFFSDSDTYVKLGQPFTPSRAGLEQTSLYFSSNDKDKSNAQDPKRKAWLSTPESETAVEPRCSRLGLSSTQPNVTESHDLSLYRLQTPKRYLQVSNSQEISDSVRNSGLAFHPRTRLVTDIPIQDASEQIPEMPHDSLGKNDDKEYVRHSSEARQRQEWRRLMFQQKRRVMDGFSLASPSSTSEDDDKQESLSFHYERTIPSYSEHTYLGDSAGPASPAASHKDAANLGFEGQSAKSISSLRLKSALHSGSDIYHSDI